MSSLTIVMYHYVREIKNSIYPQIKGLEFEGFKRQLDYLERNYSIISAEELIRFKNKLGQLPADACLLTFDDGYKDHIQYVFPELQRRRIQGLFFPPVKPVTERVMLDVNSVHFVLASCTDIQRLVRDLNLLCIENNINEEQLKEYWSSYGKADRFDSAEIIYVKRMLQHVLPERVRNLITQTLFEKYVGEAPAAFADNLYLSIDEVKELVGSGMYVGSHGYRHLWLNREPSESQRFEIDRSVTFLKDVGAPVTDWIMCYPYGAYNNDTLKILKEMNCAVGLTTQEGKANLNTQDLLELPRMDTNDFPT